MGSEMCIRDRVSASAPADELARQLPASVNSLALPSPAASTAEAIDLSAGAAIRGLLLLLLLLLLLRRVQASSPAKTRNAGVTRINFPFYYRIRLWSTCSCLSYFWSYVAGISCVRTRTRVKILRTRLVLLLYPAYECVACFVLSNCCLLYTSPSPRDGLLSRMPSSA